MNHFPEYKDSILHCAKTPKTYVNEIMKFSQDSDSVKNKVSYIWFDKFLEYILRCTKKGMNLSNSLLSKVYMNDDKQNLSEISVEKTNFEKAIDWGKPKANAINKQLDHLLKTKSYKSVTNKIAVVGALWATNTFFLAVTSAVVCIGVGLWLAATGRIVTKLRSKPQFWERWKQKLHNYFGDEEEDLPDDLQPPDIDTPNISLNLSESITSHMIDRFKITSAEVVIKIIFLLFLKAVLSLYMVESLATTIAIIAALFTPGLNLITYLLLWMSIGICTIIRYFKKPKVELKYEDSPDES